MWYAPTGADVADMVSQAQYLFELENPDDAGDIIFRLDPMVYSHHITRAIVNQFYQPDLDFVRVARDESGQLIAQTWIGRGGTPLWSRDEMAITHMAHTAYSLPLRTRVRLIEQMMTMWEDWCVEHSIPIISSSTMRQQTDGFLKMHQRRGYSLRGNVAYKRVS